MTQPETPPTDQTPGAAASLPLRKGLIVGASVFVFVLPIAVALMTAVQRQAPAPAVTAAAPAPQPRAVPTPAPREPVRVARAAQFGREKASPPVRQMADWVLSSGDNKGMSFVLVDKKAAKVFVFDPAGQLQAASPALLGAARGDDSAPGIGDKPLSQVLPQEKTTPAGRFVAELGMNTKGEDIVWVDYDAAVSMHRVRAAVKAERRLQRLASPTPADNRISFGCINLPPRFYENVLKPAVQAGGAVIYVLPETRSLRDVFADFTERGAPGHTLNEAQLRGRRSLTATHGMS
jgi:hypothetical protein